MFKHDLLRRRQTETRPVRLRRKKGLEQFALEISRNTYAGIPDTDDNKTVNHIRLEFDRSGTRNRFYCVAQQVIQHLPEQLLIEPTFT